MPCASAMQVDAAALLKAWKERFLKAPWDVNHKVLLYYRCMHHLIEIVLLCV